MVETLVKVRAESSSTTLPPDANWSMRYQQLGLAALSPTAQTIVQVDADYLVQKCIVPPGSGPWLESRVRTGIVVGAVQSGKTASMLAVSAGLLDRGLDILVVLAGTRIALWRQTYERLLAQLDGTDPSTCRMRRKKRLIIPHPSPILDAESRPGAVTYMAGEVTRFRQALKKRRPVIIVIPKIEDHLLAVSKFFEQHLIDEASNRPVEMVVLDDEADDGSILDAEVRKIIPRRIEMLWTGREKHSTMADQLYATYVAYTATPQANFLQADHNPLSPRDFCAALRAPYKSGTRQPRCPTFLEPMGIPRYYCGGEYFYVELADTSGALVIPVELPNQEGLSELNHSARVRQRLDETSMDALRAFLVGAALRLHQTLSNGGLRYSECADGVSSDFSKLFPKPHSMLIHPSASLDLHSGEAWRLVLISRGIAPDSSNAPLFDPNELALSADGLSDLLTNDESAWSKWHDQYQNTFDELSLLPGATELYDPATVPWDELRELLINEVFSNVQLRIINSNPESDDRPQFEPVELEDGKLALPRDVLTIFVSGNVMSRGITIEGLHTSLFTRSSSTPAADTQMQMQRWFGYRGANAHLCRLFCMADQLELFRQYHEHDTALRTELLASMDSETPSSPQMILTGARSLATAKIRTTRLPLHPGPYPFVRMLEVGEFAEHNARLLDELRNTGEWQEVVPGGHTVGQICDDTMSLNTLADLLDQLRYSFHDPDPLGPQYTRWQSLEKQLGIMEPLFRPPSISPGRPAASVRACPYSIAAYLRLWDASLDRPRCDGLSATDAPEQPWSLVQPTLAPPRFFVGIRYGSVQSSSWSDAGLLNGVRPMARGVSTDEENITRLDATWGSRGRSGGYLGDQFFDYHINGFTAPTLLDEGPFWRPRGHPGLVLFHVVKGNGTHNDAVTIGLALPHGGPDQFAAISQGRQ